MDSISIGNINLINADCLDLMRDMPDKAFDLAIVDPPYGNCNMGGNSVSRTGGTWASKYGKKIREWDVPPNQEYFDELFRVSKNQIIWGANYFSGLPPTRCFIVWRKLSISENFTMAMAEYAWTSFNSNAKVFECTPQGTKSDPRFHPTQKPVKLYNWLLNRYAKPNDKILDTHLGSGSICIAAHDLGLDLTGIEIDATYYQKSIERLRKHIDARLF